jgi:pilus assembly protein Flp/PilA
VNALACSKFKEATVSSFKNTFLRFIADEEGAAAAEYALILAIVGAAIATAALTLGTTIANAINRANACIEDAAGVDCVGT